jgi:hypothetical protein
MSANDADDADGAQARARRSAKEPAIWDRKRDHEWDNRPKPSQAIVIVNETTDIRPGSETVREVADHAEEHAAASRAKATLPYQAVRKLDLIWS